MTCIPKLYRANCTIRAIRAIRTIDPGGLSHECETKLHQAHLNEWAARFTEQKASGLTIQQWCDQNDVSIHKYHYWKHQLKEQVVDQMLPDIVQLSVPAPVSPSGTTLSEPPQSPAIADRANHTTANIRLCVDGVALELEPSVSEDFLRTLIRAVHYA